MVAQKIIKILKSHLCNQCLFGFAKNPLKESGDVNPPLRRVGANSHDNNVMTSSGSR